MPRGVSSFGCSVLLKLTLWKTIDPSIQSRALFFASNGEVPLPWTNSVVTIQGDILKTPAAPVLGRYKIVLTVHH